MSGQDPFVEKVRESTDVVALIGQYVELRRAGRSFKGRCPFHEEKTPSFHVNPERQSFYCFGCQKGGDAFTFLMERESLTFPEALERLAQRAGIPRPERSPGARRERGLASVVEFAVRFYESELAHADRGREARGYLKERGIKAETVLAYRLGVAGPGWENLVQAATGKVPPRLLLEAGLCVQREGGGGIYDRLRRRLVIPISSPGGVWIGLAGRALQDGEVKYLNTAESALYHKSSNLYGLNQARPHFREHSRAILVEGYLDVLTLHQAGFREAVASSGTALTAEHGRLLHRYVGECVVLYDGDEAGQNAALRCLRPLLRAGVRPRIALLEGGEDPDSLVRKHGAAALAERIEQAQEWWQVLRVHPSLPDRPESRIEAVAGLLAEVEDELLRASFVKEAAEGFQFFEDVLRAAVDRRRERALATQAPRARVPGTSGLRAPRDFREWQLLRWLAHRPDLLEQLGSLLSGDWFEGVSERALLEHLLEAQGEPPTGPAWSELLASPPEEGASEQEGWELAVALLERRWRRSISDLRLGMTGADAPERADRVQQVQELEERIQDLRMRGVEVLLEWTSEMARSHEAEP